MKKVGRLGVMGGSFNPIHIGHLVVAERAIETLRLDRLLLVPSADTPLKDPRTLAPARHRLAMAKLAARGVPKLEVSDLEVRRGGTSYTIDTIEALRPAFRTCFLILGADLIGALPRWKRAEDLEKLVTFAIAERPNFKSPRPLGYSGRPTVRAPLMDVSATEIRLRIRSRRSVRWLVPAAVERYVERHGLYR